MILHVGPGSAHNYQLGGGRSDRPLNQKVWNLELFLHELEELRKFLRLEAVILYGHSWGGIMAAEYLCGNMPSGIEKIIFASSMLGMSLFRKEIEILKQG